MAGRKRIDVLPNGGVAMDIIELVERRQEEYRQWLIDHADHPDLPLLPWMTRKPFVYPGRRMTREEAAQSGPQLHK